MSPSTIRIIVAIVFILHGLGHVLVFLAGFGVKLSENHSLNSWLFSNLLGEKASRFLGMGIALISLFGFILAGLSILDIALPQNYWQTLVLYAAIISMAGLIFYWYSFPFFIPNKAGIILVNCITIISILWIHWPKSLYN